MITQDARASHVAAPTFYPNNAELTQANADRIVACVNGCANLNPEAFAECVEALNALDEYGKARPQIGPRCMEPLAKVIDTARAAIANARKVSA